ncbi:coiled-coil domain-containing protein [Chitinophaga filiformis]|uniref:Uncharacterized protein n=1 Tax=Chitinophaga filiformis TaxID=104663 RepID=A0A1G7P5L5_CHIFI|nr:hypothetical protein [Chitinophaga filiformis]SDF81585.1 hypothetical protein SAMN04488121_1021072 [Chitinophaga filiformis]
MPTLKEQQELIEALRQQREQSSGDLYRAQINLHATSGLLGRVSKKETSLPPDVQQIAALREQIAKLQADIRTINAALSEGDSYTVKVKQQEQYIDFLQKKKEVTTARIQEDQQRLQEEESSETPDKKIIAGLVEEIAQLEKLLPELDQNIATAQNELTQLKKQQQQALDQQQQLLVSKKDLQIKLASLEADLAGLLQQGNGENMDQVLQTLKQQQAAYVQAKQQHYKNDIALSDAIAQIYVDPHPRNGVQQLNDNIPFLFMPVRIETRFITSGNLTELWLRIYPDDIAVHTHEKLLTSQELKDGITYWKALFDAEKNGGAEKEDKKKAAWNVLATTFGPQRAAWVALQTKPTNWNNLPNIESVDGLVFPSPELTKPDTWSRAPRVNVLPDRFVVTLYEGDVVTKEVVGNIIPDELFVGPDPMDADGGFTTKDDKLVFGESYDWTSDFDKAILNGMGFRIPLNATQATKGFDKILVLGVNLSASESAAQQMVEELIDNHHYSPKGFSLIPQGSATNNMDDNGSGYTKNDDFSNASYVVEAQAPLFTEADDCDGKNLANALGIEYTPLQNVAHSNGKDLEEAIAMNTALFPSTLGYYFDTMLSPVLSEAQQDKLRSFFVRHVTGRGPLPAIRVGNQPYGILLTSNFEEWKWTSTLPVPGIALPDNRFLNGLYAVLKAYSEIWKDILGKLSYVGKPGLDPSAALMDIIGLQPNSASIFQRIGYSTDYLRNLDSFKHGGKYYKDLQQSMISKTNALSFLQQLGYTADEGGVLKVPQLLRLVYQHYHTTLDAANLVDNVPLSEKDGITYYNEAAKKNYLHWLSEVTDLDVLEKQDFGAGKPIPAALLYMQLRRSLSLQLHKASILWFKKNDFPLDFMLQPANFHNIRPGGDLSKWEMMRAPVSKVAPEHPQRNSTIGAYLLGLGRDEDEAAFLTAMRKSIESLAGLPTARLERCFIEHLDTCNYRLDAWQTGMFNVRLSQQRRLQTAERQKGIYLGSYGWVEHVRPSGKRKVVTDPVPEKLKPANRPLYEYTDNGGFVHAPSLNHASAAAVLRSAYMSHATPENPDIMAVNLSSERVRRAMFILDGMRNGQTLEALLGYQFERGLHDRGSADDDLKKLNAYIYDYRAAFPLLQHVVQQTGTGTVQESIPANNVVNGVTLAEKTGGFPFGATGAVVSASVAERGAIIAEKDKLADTLDAVKDLLSAESVYQLVQGNFERCAAMLNAVKDAVIPNDLDVIETPRGSQFTFTNRVTIQFGSVDAADPASNPWPAIDMTVRAKMEAGLNKWLGKVIGDPAKIIYNVAYLDALNLPLGLETWTLEKLGIQPVDLLYITGGELNTGSADKTSVSELESRIAWLYRKAHGLEDSTAISIAFTQPEHVAGTQTLASLLPLLGNLRAVMTDSRYLDAADFNPDSKKSLADKLNPGALDHAELLARIQTARTAFQVNIGAINALSIHAEIPDPDANNLLTVYNTLETAFNALDKAKLTFEDITFTLGNVAAEKLQEILIAVSQFGVPDAFPKPAWVLTTASKAILLEQARSIQRKMLVSYKASGDVLTAAASLTVIAEKVKEYRRAGKLLLQEAFNILPLFSYNNEADVLLSHGDSAQLLSYAATKLNTDYIVEEWMQQVAHVRPQIQRWEQVRSLYELDHTGEDLPLEAVQLPYRAKDSWLAVEFPEKDPVTNQPFNIVHDTLSIVVHGDAFTPVGRQSGLLIDDWTEAIPTAEETTGISFNYNQPNAMPPQALLLAVTPQVKGHWTWDDLIGILNDTLKRAKLRAVEPRLLDEVTHPAVSVLRPAIVADFTQYDLNVSLDYRLNLVLLAEALPITSVASLSK